MAEKPKVRVPLSKVYIDQEMKDRVLHVMDSGSFILGPECKAFEAELAAWCGRKHVVLGSSWTAIAMLTLSALGIGAGDEVLVPSHTAFPTIEPMMHCGARPVFIDIDDTYCMDPALLEAAITPRTVGIMPVHLYGHPADLEPIAALARRHDLWLIEDCAQAQGARYQGRPVGSFGLAAGFSFFPSKNLTVLGDGGCVMTDDDQLAQSLRMLRNHGRLDKYTHQMAGFNLRFNDIQAAAGRVGLRNLERLNAGRRAAAARYRERLGELVKVPPERPGAYAVYHMFVIALPGRDKLAAFLKDRGIETGLHYPVPNHRQPAVTACFDNIPPLPVTERVVDEILSLPIHGEISLEDVDYVCDSIAEFLRQR